MTTGILLSTRSLGMTNDHVFNPSTYMQQSESTSDRVGGGGRMPKNFLTPWILLLSKQWRLHGYLLLQYVRNMGFFGVDHATFYKELRNLEKHGFVSSECQTDGNGPAKRIYNLTEVGEEMPRGWADVVVSYQRMINGFFVLYADAPQDACIIVPWLGISRTNVLDMLPGNSCVEFMVNQGHDVYLLDWGEIAGEDKGLGFEDAVEKVRPRVINRALALSDAGEVTLNGICLGGTISSCFLVLNPDAPVRNFVGIVAPIDFDHGDLFQARLNAKYFPTDLMVQRYGGIPASLIGTPSKCCGPPRTPSLRLRFGTIRIKWTT